MRLICINLHSMIFILKPIDNNLYVSQIKNLHSMIFILKLNYGEIFRQKTCKFTFYDIYIKTGLVQTLLF